MDFNFPMLVVIIAFVMMLFLNIYFRVKVFKHYKILVQNRVDFSVKDLIDIDKIKKEVVPKYPHVEHDIVAFVTHIRNSILIAFFLLLLITACWFILHQTR
jgi:hypothetical protein